MIILFSTSSIWQNIFQKNLCHSLFFNEELMIFSVIRIDDFFLFKELMILFFQK